MNTRIYNRENEAPTDGWYQIEVSGTHPVGDGRRQIIDQAALESMVVSFREEAAAGDGAGLLVDADHLSHDPANDTAAMAWLKELEIRGGELYGRLELTDLGEAAVQGKRYKYFSTEYRAEDLEELEGNAVRPLRLAGLAFTNRPNNRGGKPISNRDGKVPGGQSETKDTHTMKSIAEKLGLAADASEADLLKAIGALQSKCAELEAKNAEAAADAVMNRLGERVPEAVRPQWREQLIVNREATEKLLEASFPVKQETERIFNRSSARPAVAEQKGAGSEEDRAKAQAALVTAIRNRERCNFETAWNMAKGERPELF